MKRFVGTYWLIQWFPPCEIYQRIRSLFQSRYDSRKIITKTVSDLVDSVPLMANDFLGFRVFAMEGNTRFIAAPKPDILNSLMLRFWYNQGFSNHYVDLIAFPFVLFSMGVYFRFSGFSHEFVSDIHVGFYLGRQQTLLSPFSLVKSKEEMSQINHLYT